MRLWRRRRSKEEEPLGLDAIRIGLPGFSGIRIGLKETGCNEGLGFKKTG